MRRVYYEDDNLCEVVLSESIELIPKIRVYVPHSSDTENYLINQELVSRAIDRKATHIVYEMWINGVTLAAEQYAHENGITIMKVEDFLSCIGRGINP